MVLALSIQVVLRKANDDDDDNIIIIIVMIIIHHTATTNSNNGNSNDNDGDDDGDDDDNNNKQHSKAQIEIFFQSPHCAANFLKHVHSCGQGAIVCESRATHQALITCNVFCAT